MTNNPFGEPPLNPYRVRYSDRARRMADGLAQAFADHGLNAIEKWMAFKFLDGSTDGRLYLTKREAVKFQYHEEWCCYVCLSPDMGPRECESYLLVHEQLYNNGLRIADPDQEVVHIEPHQRQEVWKQHGLIIPRLRRKKRRR